MSKERQEPCQEMPMEAHDTGQVSCRMPGTFWRWVVITLSLLGALRSIEYIFRWNLVGTWGMQNSYLYTLIALFLSIVFIVYPATARSSRKSVPWYDIIFFILTLGISFFLASQAWNIVHQGWDYSAPTYMVLLALVLGLLMFEALRRAGGFILLIACAVFAIYPVFADVLPGLLKGVSYSPWEVIMAHILSENSVLGLATMTFGDLLIGFMIFGVVLVATGGGKFFLDFAFALLGHRRGGPAKVSVFASALFGMLSGSAISNVMTVGMVTIPTMKKVGYKPYFAGAVEACASTGGVLMPPVMGVTAFLMAQVLAVPYFTIALAATVPAVMYYWSLYCQVDAYAATHELKGLSKAELPSLKQTLKDGWIYVFGLALLIYFLYMRLEAQAPYIASAGMIAVAMLKKKSRMHWKEFMFLFEETGRTLGMLMAILTGIGFIIGAFSITGLGNSLSHEIVALAGGKVVPLLIFGALASFILGTGMTVTACYIFLAIMLAPALISAGLNPIAVHLFVLYWGMASYITPPVALASITAAGIARADSVVTGIQAMRLGIVIYLVPFFFIFSPALLFQGDLWPQLPILLTTLTVGTWMLASGLEGYLYGIGNLSVPLRFLVFGAGFLIALPVWQLEIVGAAVAGVIIAARLVARKSARASAV